MSHVRAFSPTVASADRARSSPMFQSQSTLLLLLETKYDITSLSSRLFPRSPSGPPPCYLTYLYPMSAATLDSTSHRVKRAKTAASPPEPAHTTKKRSAYDEDTPSGSDELEGDNDSDYHEAVAPPSFTQTKGRPRKSTKISRSARDSLRRQNHSRIEKARRTKINEALDTLRTLVPPNVGEDVNDEEEEGGDGKKRGQQKEFKLEILVRTVTYMKQLVSRVEELESKYCQSTPRAIQPRGAKRKRDEIFQQLLDEEPVPVPTSKANGEATSRASTKSPRLPPISTLLQQNNTSSDSLPSPDQLPSPPTTAEFRPRSDSTRLPSLTLPSPRSDKSQPSQDDESAATLLLHMKARSPSLTSPSTNPLIQTPASALGLS